MATKTNQQKKEKIRTLEFAIGVRERIIEREELDRPRRMMNLRENKLKSRFDREIKSFNWEIKILKEQIGGTKKCMTQIK